MNCDEIGWCIMKTFLKIVGYLFIGWLALVAIATVILVYFIAPNAGS